MDAESNVYGPFPKMSSTYDVVNFKTINFKVGDEPPFDAVSRLMQSSSYYLLTHLVILFLIYATYDVVKRSTSKSEKDKKKKRD